MIELFFHIERYNNIILSNLPVGLVEIAKSSHERYEYVLCPVLNKFKRHQYKTIPDGFIYLCTYDPNITRKIFNHYFTFFETMFASFSEKIIQVESLSENRTRKLQHNINTYIAKTKDAITNIISMDDIKYSDWKDIINITEQNIKSNTREISISLLKVFKFVSLMDAEMTVYDYLNCDDIKLDFYWHKIHKVIRLSLQPFYIDFINKNNRVHINECNLDIYIDYTSISVLFGHIWSNAVKYTMDNTDIDISFNSDNNHLDVSISMISILIKKDEINQILKENESGYWAKVLQKKGAGIGMYYVDKIMKLNKGALEIKSDYSNIKYLDGIPYTTNTFVLHFPSIR